MLPWAACQNEPDDGEMALVADDSTDAALDEHCVADPITLAPGTGWDGFIPLNEGDPVTMWYGPGAGWYIEIAGEVRNTRQNVSILPVVTALDEPSPNVIAGADGAHDAVSIALHYDDASCSGTFWSIRAYIDDDGWALPAGVSPFDAICNLEGQRLEITITLTELDTLPPARTVTSTVIATAALDPVGVAACD